ncbi:MAG: hypothetical protein HOD37_08055, partial [Bacteroidetes bacterium]|nr:hypothetical protein [Bacteroidota bacterium]
MNKTIFLLAVSMFVFTQLWAQSSKPPLDYTVYDNWKSLRGQKISNNGKLIS